MRFAADKTPKEVLVILDCPLAQELRKGRLSIQLSGIRNWLVQQLQAGWS